MKASLTRPFADAGSIGIKPGDRINWARAPRGGYGKPQDLAGIVHKISPKRVQIEVRIRKPYGSGTHWLPELKWVPKDAVRQRTLPCAAFSEPLVLKVQGFSVRTWKHPTGVSSQFKNGIWYGEIDGYQVGAPCFSEESAFHMAYQMLLDGRYRIALLTAVEHNEHWLNGETDEKYHAEATTALPGLWERMAKVEKILMGRPSEPSEVRILRGNPNRGANTGSGYGRLVPALFLREFDQPGHNVKCRLLADDPDALGKPNAADEEGWWSVSQIVWGARSW